MGGRGGHVPVLLPLGLRNEEKLTLFHKLWRHGPGLDFCYFLMKVLIFFLIFAKKARAHFANE